MKNIQAWFMVLSLFGMIETMHAAMTATAINSASTIIYNKSNMSISVTYDYIPAGLATATTYFSPSIPVGGCGSIPFNDGDVITQVTVYYNITPSTTQNPTDGSNPAVDGQIRFCINAVDNCVIYAYGNQSVIPGNPDTTNAAVVVPARYVAWWTGNINVEMDVNTTAALADQNVQEMVIMHQANIAGTNDSISALGALAAY